jgi:hypothetical protein
MDIGVRGPDLSLEQEHIKPSVSFGVEDEFVDANEVGAIVPGHSPPGSIAVRRLHQPVRVSLSAGENAGAPFWG